METTTHPTTMKVVPSGKALGAEIQGIDASKRLDDEQVQFVQDALNQYGVVVLRNQQQLQPQDQVAFAEGLGKLRVSFMTDLAVPGVPELTVVSNIVKDGKPIGLVDAGALWHTDGSYLPQPDMYTVLHAQQIPVRGGKALGETHFLSTTRAYEALPKRVVEKLDGATGIHSLTHHIQRKREANFKAPPVANPKPDVEHPAVRVHPRTGRKCVFLTEGHTKALAGMSDAESQVLLDEVFTLLKDPAHIYRHQWREGDLLIWDNCATQHLAISDYGDLPRRLHRAGIEGPVPV